MASDVVPEIADADLRHVLKLVRDLVYYRSVPDDGGLGDCAWLELRDAVNHLPEAHGTR